MKNTIRTIISLLAGVAIARSADAAQSLKLGDPAPALKVSKWVQGDPVKGFEPGKTYVVEFWATWCGPCRESIPHLNALYQQFKDKGLVVIGQDVSEKSDDGVAPFIKKMGTNMTYRVALDDKSTEPNGAMNANWMEAAGQNGIPTAFIINKHGQVVWIGHPMLMDEKLLDDILSDHYDLEKAIAENKKAGEQAQKLSEISGKLKKAMQAQDWDAANAAVDEAEKLLPKESPAPQMIRFNILLLQKKYDEAYKIADSVSKAHPDTPGLQNELAWRILAGPGLEKRDLPLAEKIAERGNKAVNGKDPSILDTLARAQFMNGKKDEAIATERKALELADADRKEALSSTLRSYQAGTLPSPQN